MDSAIQLMHTIAKHTICENDHAASYLLCIIMLIHHRTSRLLTFMADPRRNVNVDRQLCHADALPL